MREWNDIAVFAPPGDIDISTLPALRAEVDAALDAGVRRVLINCQNVGFIDSSGLAFLLSRASRLMRADGMLSLANASPAVARFIQIAKLVDVLHVTMADRSPVPTLAPGEASLWSRSIAVAEGVESLPAYRHRLVELLDQTPMSHDAVFDLALAAGEALGNAYDHAGGISCMMGVRAYRDRVVVEVVDGGAGFEIPEDEEPEATEERGRGIKLMRMLVDSVEIFRRTDAAGTVCRLVKLI